MPIPWFVSILLSVALNVVGALLAPKPKQAQPAATEDLQEPTAEAGREIPKVFGTITQKGGNIIGAWDKESIHRDADTGAKK